VTKGKKGFYYVDSQTATTAAFDDLTVDDRKCVLPDENRGMKLFRRFSKSGCEYECAVEIANQGPML
jgi:hypothetical protein